MTLTTVNACAFCDIVEKRAPASLVHEDADFMAFMDVRPVRPGACVVIPKSHVDHFTDLSDDAARGVMTLAIRVGRRMREAFGPLRVGMVVHGFGVAHAHMVVVPQHDPDDITSRHFVRAEGGRLLFSRANVPPADRAQLDEQARRLRIS